MEIDGKTNIPLFAVLASIPILVGFIFWISTIYSITLSAQSANAAQDIKIDQTRDLLIDIRERVIRIEERITTK
jgi:hypothetical protein